MHLYLMRHGEAGEAATDRARALTARGRADVRAAAEGLKSRGARISSIVHSPYARTTETALIAAGVLGVHAVDDDRFVPEASVVAAKAAVSDKDGLLVVAHMPILPRLLELLTGARLPFPTAGVAHIEHDGRAFQLLGLYPEEPPH